MPTRREQRDEAIYVYHTAGDPKGLKCPLCGRWSPLDFTPTMGVHLVCGYGDCGVVAVMPRVPLARAITRQTSPRKKPRQKVTNHQSRWNTRNYQPVP